MRLVFFFLYIIPVDPDDILIVRLSYVTEDTNNSNT